MKKRLKQQIAWGAPVIILIILLIWGPSGSGKFGWEDFFGLIGGYLFLAFLMNGIASFFLDTVEGEEWIRKKEEAKEKEKKKQTVEATRVFRDTIYSKVPKNNLDDAMDYLKSGQTNLGISLLKHEVEKVQDVKPFLLLISILIDQDELDEANHYIKKLNLIDVRKELNLSFEESQVFLNLKFNYFKKEEEFYG